MRKFQCNIYTKKIFVYENINEGGYINMQKPLQT